MKDDEILNIINETCNLNKGEQLMNFFKFLKIALAVVKKVDEAAKDGVIDGTEVIDIVETLCKEMDLEVI